MLAGARCNQREGCAVRGGFFIRGSLRHFVLIWLCLCPGSAEEEHSLLPEDILLDLPIWVLECQDNCGPTYALV